MKYRFSRTALGPIWNVIGTGALILAMGLTFGVVLNQPLATFLPYIAASMAIWNCLNGIIQEAPNCFSRNVGIITVYSLPISIHVYRLLFDKFVLLAYFLIVYIVVIVEFGKMPTLSIVLFPLALAVYFLFGAGVCLAFGVWGARFRDLGPAVQSIMSFVFLLTPIFWQRSAAGANAWFVEANPFYHLMEIGRAPLLGYYPTLNNWAVSLTVMALALAIGGVTFVTGRRTIFYWI